MQSEADILQQRIEAKAFHGRFGQPLERVGTQQQEGIETERDEALRGQRSLHGLFGQAALHRRDQAAGQRHDRHPQQHRAFVVAPCARKLENQRLERMRIRRNQLHRQVGNGKDIKQRKEGKSGQAALQYGGRPRETGDAVRLAPAQRQSAADQLQQRQRRRQPQGCMAEFGNHSRPTVVSSAISAAWCSLMPSSSRGT